jgi:hypothetical protein
MQHERVAALSTETPFAIDELLADKIDVVGLADRLR